MREEHRVGIRCLEEVLTLMQRVAAAPDDRAVFGLQTSSGRGGHRAPQTIYLSSSGATTPSSLFRHMRLVTTVRELLQGTSSKAGLSHCRQLLSKIHSCHERTERPERGREFR
jgi:hypothetical protein